MREGYYNGVPLDRTTIYRGNRPIAIATLLALLLSLPAWVSAQRQAVIEDPTVRLLALDPRWTVAFETAPSAPAGYDEDMGYVPLKGGELMAIDLNEGVVKWKVPLTTTLTPATGDGLVFASEEGLVTAFDQRTGRTLWRTPLPSPLAAPLFWDSGWLLASTEAGELVAMKAEDGSVIWRQPLGAPLSVPPSPSGDRVYVALRDGRIVGLELEKGTVLWSYPLNQPVTGMLALEDQLVVGTRGNQLHSLALTRARIRWSQRAGADISGAPVADDQLIYFAAFDNVLRAIERRTGNLKWTRNLLSRPAGGPLRTGNVVLMPLVTTDIGAFTAATGAEAFTIRAIGELSGVPFLRESARPTAPRLIAMSREGALQGFSQRFEPVPAPLAELPGVKVTGH
ncbi:MAG TPA: PQQ-binding-like beta-propeller repeat protein [Vicinamibacterales bacterium]|nr:PQQ-binding-like beta-propeller repeat protein [Vicinamibacterales bacterium]